MSFNKLSQEQKEVVSQEVLDIAMSMGGKNRFLGLIEAIKEEEEHPLLNKNKTFHYLGGKIAWNKTIFKDTFERLTKLIRKEEREGSLTEGLNPRETKNLLNTLKTLKPIEITITPKEGEPFSTKIVENSNEDKSSVSMLFKILFFYNINFVKKILNGNI
jgi:hypothetical protein